jgi:tetratricopeptide (TPR) repeat protein
MELVAMNCPQCGAKLEVKTDNSMPYCPYCGSKISISYQAPSPTNDLQLGLSYLQLGKYKQSDACFSRLLEKIPTSNLAWFWKAINAIAQKRFRDAILYWQKSGISRDDTVSQLIQILDKPYDVVLCEIIYQICYHGDRAWKEGGWEFLMAINQAGVMLGDNDWVKNIYYLCIRIYAIKPSDFFYYILQIYPSQKNLVIETCLEVASGKGRYIQNPCGPELRMLCLEFVKKIETDSDKQITNF